MATATVQIRVSDVDELRENAGNLFVEHYDEVGRGSGVPWLDPDWERLELLQDAGVLVLLTAWFADQCVGYSIGVLSSHTHCKDYLLLFNDSLYVAQEARSLGAWQALKTATEDRAAEANAACVWYAPKGGVLDQVLTRCDADYEATHIVHTRRVG